MGEKDQVTKRLRARLDLKAIKDQHIKEDDGVRNPWGNVPFPFSLGIHEGEKGDVFLQQFISALPLDRGLHPDVDEKYDGKEKYEEGEQPGQVLLDEDDGDDGEKRLDYECLFFVLFEVFR